MRTLLVQSTTTTRQKKKGLLEQERERASDFLQRLHNCHDPSKEKKRERCRVAIAT